MIAFSRLAGLSLRDTVQVTFVHNLVLNSGWWGCIVTYSAARGTYFHRRFVAPRKCLIANNVLAGSVEGRAIRIPIPTKELHDNVISGNLIHSDQEIFQVEDVRQEGALSFDAFVGLATSWLTEHDLAKGHWPDFGTWKVDDRWYMGECRFEVLRAIVGAQGDHYRRFGVPEILGRLDRFTTVDPSRWPAKASRLPGLSAAYTLRVNGSD